MSEKKSNLLGNKKNVHQRHSLHCMMSTIIETDDNTSSRSSSSESEYVSAANSRKRKSRLEKEDEEKLDLPDEMGEQNILQSTKPRRKRRSKKNTLIYELVGAVLSPPSPLRDNDILNWPEAIAYPPPVYKNTVAEEHSHQLNTICSESECVHIEKRGYEINTPR